MPHLVMGPAAWRFGWGPDDWDALAGALVAGHVIECGAQCTGGNFSFFDEIPGLEHPGFPLVEIDPDGSFVVTKHPGTGGAVTVETVTAQLLYEIAGPRYLNPDVTARFDTIRLIGDGPDRVRVTGVRGEPPPPTVKVALNYLGGYRNTVTFLVPGLDVVEKGRVALEALWDVGGGRDRFAAAEVRWLRSDRPDPADNDQAVAQLSVTVKDPDADKVGRAFSRAAVELGLASYPGFAMTAPPGDSEPYAVYWPTTVPRQVGRAEGGSSTTGRCSMSRPAVPRLERRSLFALPSLRRWTRARPVRRRWVWWRVPGPATRAATPTSVCGRAPRPGTAGSMRSSPSSGCVDSCQRPRVSRSSGTAFPNIAALNFVIHGLLGEGVASSTRLDPQAKTLGEYLRAKLVDIPEALLDTSGSARSAGGLPLTSGTMARPSQLLYRVYENRLSAELDRTRLPRHLGIILDGHRRYARSEGMSDYSTSYRAGMRKFEDCHRLG